MIGHPAFDRLAVEKCLDVHCRGLGDGHMQHLSQKKMVKKRHKPPPHEFVLDALASLSPETKPMFGCLAVYVGDKIVLILRDKPTHAADNGVRIATTKDHHEALRRGFP